MLSAKIEEEEADRFCAEHGLKKEIFCHVAEADLDPNKGDLVIRMPCRMLLGRPADYVSCRAYGGYRPAVCGDYLCRVAVQYKAGFLELDEALEDIRRAFYTGNVVHFNWTRTDDEGNLLKASMIPKLLARAREAYEGSGNPDLSLEDVENIFVSEAFTPVFVPESATSHLKLNMIFDIFDRGELDLVDVVGPIGVEDLDIFDDEALSLKIALRVVGRFRALFKKEDP